jgi:hypothetical protein
MGQPLSGTVGFDAPCFDGGRFIITSGSGLGIHALELNPSGPGLPATPNAHSRMGTNPISTKPVRFPSGGLSWTPKLRQLAEVEPCP